MSLNRYANKDTIIKLNEPQYGQVFTAVDLKLLPYRYLVPDDQNIISNSIPQVHIYSFYGDYIAGDHNASYITRDNASNSLLINLADTFRSANIRRGSYIIAVNLFKKLWGSPDNETVILRRISPDRTELELSAIPGHEDSEQSIGFRKEMQRLIDNDELGGTVIDFGFNRVCNVSLIKYDKVNVGTFYVKLQHPLIEDVNELDFGWVGYEVMDSYVDTVILTTPIGSQTFNAIPGPNFDIDTTAYTSNATAFKTWDDVLDADLPTSQRIIDLSISGSGTAILNIDYSDYSNFIFYSSAVERTSNFLYKVGQIETYNSSIYTLQHSTASVTTFISSSVSTLQRRVDRLTTTFDHFERWLYYDATSSLFTHDHTGSIKPYPKYLSGGKYYLHPTTSSIVTSWYSQSLATASIYDHHNHNRLYWSIPEHILMDEANSDYVLLIEMISQHFDNLYSYIRALTQIHERDEHFDRGAQSGLLWHIAKSYGWNLQNTRQLSDLWFYKLGTNSTGSFESTGSMFSLTHENQSKQIWKRIVNNLPYLLKTKGTSRSVKALMSIYGIPQTLISIKEYGGPAAEADRPQMIEDRFAYMLNFSGSQSVEMNRYRINPGTGSWDIHNSPSVVPDTVMFRFATDYSGSTNMSLWSIENKDSGVRSTADIRLRHIRGITGTGSYSGSYAYGRLDFIIEGGTTSSYSYYSGSTPYLPLFDGDAWTVRLWTNTPVTSSTATASFNLEVARADDCTYGTYVISGSTMVTAYSSMPGANFGAWSVLPLRATTPNVIRLGGTTASLGIASASVAGTASFFSGSMQAYKEYFSVVSESTFREHVLNPSAYHVDEPTGSFYDMYRYFPLGADAIRYDHTVSHSISSSQPNRDINFASVAKFNRFTGGQADQYESVNETYYVYTPTIGVNNVRNNKLRVESSRLVTDLSPSKKSDRSQYDFSTFDSSRLAIVFSLSDQINKDIYNEFGFTELDDWIAEPGYEFNQGYSELKRFANEYWKKYEARNDINAFIRILSVYDYTFFEQIRQLAPGRSDLIAGILIEPNILERSKVQLTRRPTIEYSQLEDTITYSPTPTGQFKALETIVSSSMDFTVKHTYLTASLSSSYDFTVRHTYLTTSLADPWIITSSFQNLCGTVRVFPECRTGSKAETGSFYSTPRSPYRCKYKKVIFHYSSSNSIQPKYLRNWYTAVSMSYNWYYSRSLVETSYQIYERGSRNVSRFVGSKLSSPDFNVNSPDTIDGGPVVSIWESNPNSLINTEKGRDGGLIVE